MGTATGFRIGIGCAAAAVTTAFVPLACGDADGEGEVFSITSLEQSLCEKVLACGCGEAFADFGLMPPVTCEGWSLADASPTQEDGYYYAYGDEYGDYDEPLPVSVDEACLARLEIRIDALACGDVLGLDISDCRDYCAPLIGPRLQGQSCRAQEECGRGLRCNLGECMDPCAVRTPIEGDPCPELDCGPSLLCDPSESEQGVCRLRPGAGAECLQGECAEGLRCDGSTNTCLELAGEGQACTGHRTCITNYCPAGYCEQAPAANQPCGVDDACAPGSACEYEGDGGSGVCREIETACGRMIQGLFALEI